MFLVQKVATLVNEYKEAGIYSLNFSSNELNNKIEFRCLFHTIKAGQSAQTRKMVINEIISPIISQIC